MRVDKVMSMAARFRQRATVGLGVLLGAEASSVMFGATRVAACESGDAAVGEASSASPKDTGAAKPDGDSDEDKLIDIIVESFTKVLRWNWLLLLLAPCTYEFVQPRSARLHL
jgi:hypothetical protein